MKSGRPPLLSSLSLLALCVLFVASVAHADVYGDLQQLLRGGKLVEAEAQADLHLKSKPRDPQMRYLKGLIQRETGRVDEALATFHSLTEDFPELPEPYNGLAVIHASQGRYEEARVALEQALRAHPGYTTARENLGDVYVRLARLSYCSALRQQGASPELQGKLSGLGLSCP
ncbi:MAG: tetratricopeptide repeat protein [bacterium]|jgi:Flp pilus assembly protein TadD